VEVELVVGLRGGWLVALERISLMRVCLLLSMAMVEVGDVMSVGRLLRRGWLGGDGDDSLSSAVFLLAIIR
jgi:hypothetical protein